MKQLSLILHYTGVALAGVWIVSITINSLWLENNINHKKENQSLI